MKKSNVADRRRVKLEKITQKDYIPFLEGRPERERVIGHDDLVNLTIALQTSKTIDELFKHI